MLLKSTKVVFVVVLTLMKANTTRVKFSPYETTVLSSKLVVREMSDGMTDRRVSKAN
jgi:hypothetical protein